MDWARAIERNRDALKAIVAALYVMLGSAAAARLPRALHRAVLNVLGPAESAARRLIVIAARGLTAKAAPSRPMPSAPIGRGGRHRVAFPLFDPPMRFAPEHGEAGPRAEPRIHCFGRDPRVTALWPSPEPSAVPIAPPDDGQIDARRLRLRFEVLERALDDLPRQARRLVRWRTRREKLPSLTFKSPLRPGRPPGTRKRPVHEVDYVLAECHGLARDAMALNTS